MKILRLIRNSLLLYRFMLAHMSSLQWWRERELWIEEDGSFRVTPYEPNGDNFSDCYFGDNFQDALNALTGDE